MRRTLLAAVLAGATLFTPGLIPEARASHDWFAIGTAFRIGAAHISFVFGRPSYGYDPAYYYRYDRPVHYRDHHCSRYCFRDAGSYYHHESCPLIGAHFQHYQVDPYWAFSRYAPRINADDYGYRGRYRGYGDHDRYGRYDRYDDRDRYDRDDRYERDRYERDRYDRDRYGRDRHDRDHRRGYDNRRDRRDRGHRHYRGCGH
jgi:hypothetical protein